MTERPSLGQLYTQPAPPARTTSQHDLAGSLGEQFSEWIAEDTVTKAVALEVDDATEVGTQFDTSLPGRLGRQWYVDNADSFATRDEVAGTDAPDRADEAGSHPTDRVGRRTASYPTHPVETTPAAGADVPAAPGAPQSAGTARADQADQRPAPSGRAGLARAGALMAAGTLVSRLLGFLRGTLQAAAIGTTTVPANVWSTANTLPNIVYLLLAGGVINAVLVPQITKSLQHEDGGKGYTDRLLTLAFTILGVLTVLCVAAAPLLYKLYDFNASGSRLALGWSFALICLPQIFFYGMYALLGQVLNARGRFGAFMWAPALANVVAIAGLVYFLARMPRQASIDQWDSSMIWVLAGSATLGIVLQALCLIPVLRRDGYRFSPNFRWRGVGLRAASKVALWAFAAVILQQLGLVVTTNVLNTQPNGEPGKASQEYAFLLFMLPHSLLTVSLVTALFTQMSRAANARNHALVRRDVREGLRLIGVATIPCTVGGIVLAEPLITAFYGEGSVWPIGSIMVPMLLGLSIYGLCVTVQRAFYAYEDARTPFRMQLLCTGIAVVITLGALLVPDRYVGIGIGLALTVSNAAQGFVGLRWLQRTTGRIMVSDIVRSYVRLTLAALVAGVVAFVVFALLAQVVSGRSGALVVLVVAGPIFLLVYVLVARRLQVKEVEELLRPITRRLRRA